MTDQATTIQDIWEKILLLDKIFPKGVSEGDFKVPLTLVAVATAGNAHEEYEIFVSEIAELPSSVRRAKMISGTPLTKDGKPYTVRGPFLIFLFGDTRIAAERFRQNGMGDTAQLEWFDKKTSTWVLIP